MTERHTEAEVHPDGPLVQQAGAIPYRKRPDGAIEVLLVTATSGGWTIPKGLIDPGMTAPRMAEVEALEEAGAIGVCENTPIGAFDYDKWTKVCRVRVFPMPVDRVLESWAGEDERDRAWFGLAESVNKVRLPQMGEVIAKFAQREGIEVPGVFE